MIVFRCDANDTIGYGHFFRCLSIAAHAKKNGYQVRIIAETISDVMGRYATAYQLDIQTTPLSPQVLHSWAARWIVYDGYHFHPDEIAELSKEFQILMIDDLAVTPICADVLVNPNFGSEKLSYFTGTATIKLCGPDYAPLRPEFVAGNSSKSEDNTVFVCLGGGENSHALSEVVSAIPTNFKIVLVPGRSQLPDVLETNILVKESPLNMAEVMQTCRMAVVNAGSTVWECLTLGLRVGVVKLYENQAIVARELARVGIVDWLNPSGELDIDALRHFLEVGPQGEVPKGWRDGGGATRILQVMEEKTVSLSIRCATVADMRAVWEINNHPTVRANALNEASIPYESHSKWYQDVLTSKHRLLWVSEANSTVVGVVRVDLDEDARITIAIHQDWRGKGVGRSLLQQCMNRLSVRPDIRELSAQIRQENVHSRALFEQLGFRYSHTDHFAAHAVDFLKYTMV